MSDVPLDLLAFGPHPDDIEIGFAGTIARHAAAGFRVGLCDLSRGELASNGTSEERLEEAEAARAVLGAVWRGNLAWPDGQLDADPWKLGAAVDIIRRWRPRTVAIPYWRDRHPDHVAAAKTLTAALFQSGLRRYETGAEPWRPEWVCHYFINDSGPVSFVIDVSPHYDVKRRALACHRSQFDPAYPGTTATRLTSPRFLQLIESRDAQFGAQVGVDFAEGIFVGEPLLRFTSSARTLPRFPLAEAPLVNIGIVCYASLGGSGIVATELGQHLAERGHDVHLLSSDPPFRLRDYTPRLHSTGSRRRPIRSSGNRRYSCSRSRTRSSTARASMLWTSFTPTMRSPTRPRRTWPSRSLRRGGRRRPVPTSRARWCRRSSPRFTAPTSPSSAAIPRTPRPWRLASDQV